MQRVDTSTSVTDLPAQNDAGTPGYFTQGNAASGLAATSPGQDWYNIVQEELMAIVEAAGITPDKATTNQVLQAIMKIAAADNSVNDFRLTLTSETPVTTGDITGATTIYCTPYKGNRIALYNGTIWETITSVEISKTLGELTSGLPHDVFCYSDEGVATLEYLTWSSSAARATALARQDGILVKSGDATRRYLGTFYTTSTTTTEDSAAKRYLYNHYHRRERLLSGTFSTNRSTSSTSLTEINSEIRVQYVVGVAEDPVEYKFQGSGYNSYGSYVSTAIADNSTSVALSGKKSTIHAQSVGEISISGKAVPAIGQHFVTLLGAAESNSSTYNYADAEGTGVHTAKCVLSACIKG